MERKRNIEFLRKRYNIVDLTDLNTKYKNLFVLCSDNDDIAVKNIIFGRVNSIHNGAGDTLRIIDLIKRYPKIDILQELDWGVVVEYEHTDEFYKSLDIAMDHMAEFPDYYTRLLKMEEEGEKYWEK